MQERGTVSADRTERKNAELLKSCEQVVGSGWVPLPSVSQRGEGRAISPLCGEVQNDETA